MRVCGCTDIVRNDLDTHTSGWLPTSHSCEQCKAFSVAFSECVTVAKSGGWPKRSLSSIVNVWMVRTSMSWSRSSRCSLTRVAGGLLMAKPECENFAFVYLLGLMCCMKSRCEVLAWRDTKLARIGVCFKQHWMAWFWLSCGSAYCAHTVVVRQI